MLIFVSINFFLENIFIIFIFKIKFMKDFWVECAVCKTQYKNWVGSTPCCGSLAFVIENIKDIRLKKLKKLYGI